MSMQTNLHGRLRNTSLLKSHGLMPLFVKEMGSSLPLTLTDIVLFFPRNGVKSAFNPY